MCGGTHSPASFPFLLRGLSPRVRGNRAPDSGAAPRSRSIPACAGEPATAGTPSDGFRVYPRVCGGTARARQDREGYPGLSPRVRGNRRVPVEQRRAHGSIPACAGEPGASASGGVSGGVYPRVCGGTGINWLNGPPAEGLSPRVRGNLARREHGPARRGSIPACAGEPPYREAMPSRKGVYPRVCGGTM